MTINVLLLTVWHTGTHTFLHGLKRHYEPQGGRATYSHLNERWRQQAATADIVYTTYRDPLRVAASWGNRGRFDGDGTQRWMEMWRCFNELQEAGPILLFCDAGNRQHGIEFPGKPLNAFKDDRHLHQALNEKDLDFFYRKVPKFGIDHAVKCSQWVKHAKTIAV